jgi:quinol monooxygenase YgiN
MATSRPQRDGREIRVFAVTRLRATGEDGEALADAVGLLLTALAARPGFRDGELGRSADDPTLWAMVTRWDGVGSYRRALSAAEVKITGAPVWVHAVDEPGVYLPGEDPGDPRRQA